MNTIQTNGRGPARLIDTAYDDARSDLVRIVRNFFADYEGVRFRGGITAAGELRKMNKQGPIWDLIVRLRESHQTIERLETRQDKYRAEPDLDERIKIIMQGLRMARSELGPKKTAAKHRKTAAKKRSRK